MLQVNRCGQTIEITTDDVDLLNELQNSAENWDEYRRFREELADLPVPTKAELQIIRSTLYNERIARLKKLIELEAPREIVDVACRLTLLSIHGSKERAIQEWLHDSASPQDLKGEKQ